MSFNGEDQSYQFDESAEEVDLSGLSSKDTDVDTMGDESMQDDPELEVIKARVKEMEEEAEKIKEMQNEVEKQYGNMVPSSKGSPPALSVEEKLDADTRSVWIGNVDYGATAEELEAHFHGCGSINRVTIMCDKYTGHPKGFAYVEFADKDAVNTAMALDESLFRGRQIKVTCKRTNRPGISTTNRPPRARVARPRYGYAPIYATHMPRFRGRFRPRKSFHYSPY